MKINYKVTCLWLALLVLIGGSCARKEQPAVTVLETTDIHGVILPYDYIERKDLDVSLAAAATYIKSVRAKEPQVILLDDGDNLQGQPEVYYYNFIDTVSPHLNAEAMNFLHYDACTVGNHDIEAGHSTYDRLVKEYNFPLLAANAVDKKTGNPYFKPYAIIERSGVRVAIFGLITPAIPTWLPPELYSGIEFRDMLETAKLWMPVMQKEKPDVVIGLFHSGWDDREGATEENPLTENGTAAVARNVPGFNIIMAGHDHRVFNKKIVNSAGDTVLILDGGSRAEKVARADIIITSGNVKGKKQIKVKGDIIDVKDYRPDNDFTAKFAGEDKAIRKYVDKIIAKSGTDISSRDSYFGSSAFVDMVHQIQLDITHADVSFAAPLSFDVKIASGPVTVSDMFKLYRFENMLYTMSLTGNEIRKYLEFSYSGWLNTMKGPGDLLLQLRLDKSGKPFLTDGKAWLKNHAYNFDSAAGINYTVDVSKPEGERVRIKSFTDGRPFDPDKYYKVAVNSYRGNGGGGHLTEGAGIEKDELSKRLITSTDKDLRYYIMKYLEVEKTINARPLNNWKIIPEQWVKDAKAREYGLLFGN
jgi:2',3'-cyclic-nucleotide 2'-phosphodiesterase / 3'-nucleotidase